MKLILIGHDYKYAAEQIMLVLFPQEKPEYPLYRRAREDNTAVISLKWGESWVTAHTTLYRDGRVTRGMSREKTELFTDELVTDRLGQKIVKLSFYKAAVDLTGQEPQWGALTGIRPGKLVSNMLEAGKTEKQAVREMEKTYFVQPRRAKLCLDTARAGLKAKGSLEKRDIALYVGIPFCPTRCAYCSFVSLGVEKSMKLIEPFLEALYQEIEATAKAVTETGLRIVSLYFGGGTPTTLSAPQLRDLLRKMQESFDLSALRELTVEAGRPDTITREKLEALKEGGATRISINPQTMSDEVLKTIGRRHTAQAVLDAYQLAREVGGMEVNMDLIAGLPGDSPESFRRTLDIVTELGAENVTVHTLSLKKGARLTLEGTPIPDGDAVGQMLDYTEEKLTRAGYTPYYLYRQKFMSGGYENVGWAKPGTENLYNILIMEELCTILALGGGGSTKLTNPKQGRIERIFNHKYPLEYIQDIRKNLAEKEAIGRFYREQGVLD